MEDVRRRMEKPKPRRDFTYNTGRVKDRLALARDVTRVKTVLYMAVALGLGAI